MRVLLWHGWVLEGAGSNIYAARVAEVLRRQGHDVLLLCQEPHPERYGFLDGWGEVGAGGVGEIRPTGSAAASGRAVLLRPDIGGLLPVFVYDEYESFEVKRFVDLSEEELEGYLERNVKALRRAAAWHDSEVVIAGHAVPGPVVARRALGEERYLGKIHGSDLEYAVREQDRYRELAAEGLSGARAVVGASDDVLRRTIELVPEVAGRIRKVAPGVDVERFAPMDRGEALRGVAEPLATDPDTARGRPSELDADVRRALERRDAAALDGLAGRYDQTAPDPDAADRIRSMAGFDGPLVGYIGKLIPQKGVQTLLAAVAGMGSDVRTLVIGFGLYRERLTALVQAIEAGDSEAVAWLGQAETEPSASGAGLPPSPGFAGRVTFTGRLDHRYAPAALAGMDVLVVPSILEEAFGMVAAEGAAAGALPLVARHSGLAEISAALEGEVGRPGLFSFEPGPGSVGRVRAGLEQLLSIPATERTQLRAAVAGFVRREWTWERTAERLLQAFE